MLAEGEGTTLWVRPMSRLPAPVHTLPPSPHRKPFFTPRKILQMESEVRLASLRYHLKDQEGEKQGLFKLLGKSRSNMVNEKSTQTHKEHKSEELNNIVNKGIITLDASIHTQDLLKTSHFKMNEEH